NVVDVSTIAAEAPQQQHDGECSERRHGSVRSQLPYRALKFGTTIHSGEAGLREDDILEKTFDEICASLPRVDDSRLPLHPQLAQPRAEDAIERRAILRPTGEVHTAQKQRPLVMIGSKHLRDEFRQ